MGLLLHSIKSLKLNDGSTVVTDFKSDVEISVGDVLNILDVDYQIKEIIDNKLFLNKPYEYIGELIPEKLKLKKLPEYIKSQVRKNGELYLITIEDMALVTTKKMGIYCPGWWNVQHNNGRYRVELLMPVRINDEVVIEEPETTNTPKNTKTNTKNVAKEPSQKDE